MPYSAYPVVSKSDLTLAEAEEYVTNNAGQYPENYWITPVGERPDTRKTRNVR
jgi:hypothetical protein